MNRCVLSHNNTQTASNKTIDSVVNTFFIRDDRFFDWGGFLAVCDCDLNFVPIERIERLQRVSGMGRNWQESIKNVHKVYHKNLNSLQLLLDCSGCDMQQKALRG